MSTEDLSYLLDGESSQGRGSEWAGGGSDPPNNHQQDLTWSNAQSIRDVQYILYKAKDYTFTLLAKHTLFTVAQKPQALPDHSSGAPGNFLI